MKTLLVTAPNGGVGATTVAARTGLALASCNARVLAMEFGNSPAMDLITGAAEELLYDVTDVADGRVSFTECAHKVCDSFYLIKGAFPLAGVKLRWNADTLCRLLKQAEEEFGADYLILDAPPTPGLLRILAPLSTEAIAVVAPTAVSKRSAEALGGFLSAEGLEAIRMVVNGVDPENPPVISEMIDETRIPLLGAVLLSEALQRAGEEGAFALKNGDPCRICFQNIAHRIMGEQTPLFAGMKASLRKKLIQ